MTSKPTGEILNARNAAGIIAAIGWAALLAQTFVAYGEALRLGGGAVIAVWRVLAFYTILTNILVATVLTLIALDRWPKWLPAKAWVLGGLAVQMVIVGIVYHAVLANLWQPKGLHWWADQGLHSVVPALLALYWAMFAPKSGLTYRDAAVWLIYPLGYFIYAMLRGTLEGWYPYPFLDVGKLGMVRASVNALVISLVMYLFGLGLVALARQMTGEGARDRI
jgi:hypothetical protein